MQPTIKQKVVKIQVQGKKPIKYQWFKDDVKLSDGDKHYGCTTPDLVIVGTGPQVKGEYSCQVENRQQGKMSSEKILYRKYKLYRFDLCTIFNNILFCLCRSFS